MFKNRRIDPLELLREYIIQKKTMKQKTKNNEYKLLFEQHNLEFKLSAETAWKSTKSGKEYKLGDLWWFLECKLKGIDNREYRQKTLDMKIDFISKPDQDEIVEYFTGKIDYTECINAEKKSQLFKKHQDTKKEDEIDPSSGKRVKVEGEKDQPLSEKDYNLKVLDEILRFEKPITTRNRLFRVNDKNFENILNISKQIFYGQYLGDKTDNDEQGQQFQSSILYKFLKSKEKPIILIPAIFEMGNIVLKNAQQFLEQGEYLQPQQINFTLGERSIHIKAKLKQSNQELIFQITDTPNTLTPKDWSRVVAVFLRGSVYEIKSFPEQDHNILFKNIRGYHLKFEEDKLKDQIKQWNVKILELHRTKRHYDQTIQASFWEDLEKFLLKPAAVAQSNK